MTRRSLAAQTWYSLLWCLCWVACHVWFRFRYTGRAHVPAAGPVLLVANHQSHLDPVLVGVASPRQTGAMARHSLFVGPFGWLIRSLGAVPIDRGRGAAAGFKQLLTMLRNGETLLVFPEGTRTPDGQLHEFHPGFCALARRGDAVVVPVAILGAFDALPRGSGFPRPTPVQLHFCQPITPHQAVELTDDQLVNVVRERIQATIEAPPTGS